MKLKTIATYLLLFIISNVSAQKNAADSVAYQLALLAAKHSYRQFMGHEAEIFNGPAAKSFNYKLETGSRFFIPVQTMQGKVLYNGLMYTDIPLLYDVLNNKLITSKPAGNQQFEILIQQVGYFELDNHRFIHLQNPPAKNMPAGFYEIHFEGQKSAVYEIHSKLLNEDLGEQYKKYFIEDNSIIYVKKDGAFFRVDKKKDLFRIYENRQAEIKSYIKSNQLKLTKVNAATLAKIAAFFETP